MVVVGKQDVSKTVNKLYLIVANLMDTTMPEQTREKEVINQDLSTGIFVHCFYDMVRLYRENNIV